MNSSKKELILKAIQVQFETIKKNLYLESVDYTYQNDISYIDRQYITIQLSDIDSKPKPWVIINNNGETFGPLVGKKFENIIHIDIIGFVTADENNPDLDTIMNILQKDLIIAMLTNETLSGLCDYIRITAIETVPEMIYPHGGFAIPIEITYHCSLSDM